MKTAVIYLRVSTDKQRLGGSFARQLDYCKAWCLDKGVEIVGIITECCSGYSGEHVKRDVLLRHKKAQLGKFLNKLGEGFRVDYLVFEEWDRFSRLPWDKTMELKGEFNKFGVELVSVGLGYPYKFSDWTDNEKHIIANVGYHELCTA